MDTKRRHPIDVTLSPMYDYTKAAWSITAKEFLRWCKAVVSLQECMDVDGKQYLRNENSTTYARMKMETLVRFYRWMDLVSTTEKGKKRAIEESKKLSAQVKDVKDMF